MLSLSICIPTLNRAKFIEETLQSIVSQYDGTFEIVVVDGGSVDGTLGILKRYCEEYAFFRYFSSSSVQPKAPSNEGFDRDCDMAVQLADGQYCWLMTDDDLLVPDAIHRVQPHLDHGHDAVVVGVTVKDFHLNRTLYRKRPCIEVDKCFTAEQSNDFFVEASLALTFVGCLIVRRDIWMNRNRAQYFGSGFVHMGVMFQCALQTSAALLASPLVTIRYGNALWTPRAFQILMIDFPKLIWSFEWLDGSLKRKVVARQPWLSFVQLLKLKALGAYDMEIFNKHLADTPMRTRQRLIAKLAAKLPRALTWIGLMMVFLPYGLVKKNHLHTYDLLYVLRQPKK